MHGTVNIKVYNDVIELNLYLFLSVVDSNTLRHKSFHNILPLETFLRLSLKHNFHIESQP